MADSASNPTVSAPVINMPLPPVISTADKKPEDKTSSAGSEPAQTDKPKDDSTNGSSSDKPEPESVAPPAALADGKKEDLDTATVASTVTSEPLDKKRSLEDAEATSAAADPAGEKSANEASKSGDAGADATTTTSAAPKKRAKRDSVSSAPPDPEKIASRTRSKSKVE